MTCKKQDEPQLEPLTEEALRRQLASAIERWRGFKRSGWGLPVAIAAGDGHDQTLAHTAACIGAVLDCLTMPGVQVDMSLKPCGKCGNDEAVVLALDMDQQQSKRLSQALAAYQASLPPGHQSTTDEEALMPIMMAFVATG